jgi:hypothetical protein
VFFQKEENHSAARLPDLPAFFSSTLPAVDSNGLYFIWAKAFLALE